LCPPPKAPHPSPAWSLKAAWAPSKSFTEPPRLAALAGGGTVFKFDIRPPLLSVKPVQFLVINNQILAFTNIVAYTNTMGQINVFYVTNYTRITNHIGVVSSYVAATWRQDDGMTHDLVRSSSLNQSLDQWLPQPPNWTNSMDPNEVGWLLKPNPGDPPAFFRFRSVDP